MAKKRTFMISRRYQEIFRVLSDSQKTTSGNFIWKMIDKRRKTFPIRIVTVDGDLNRIEVRFIEPTRALDIGDEVYLKLSARDSAFKTVVLERVFSSLVLTFPDEVVLNENRTSIRSYFHATDEKPAQIKRVKNQVSSLREKAHNVQVLDISEEGLSVFLPLSLGHYYDVNSRIVLDSIGPFHLPNQPIGQVVFKMAMELKRTLSVDQGFKLGIQLDSKIPAETLERYVLKKSFSITDEQIVKDEAFRKKISSEMRTMAKNISGKRAFKEMFAQLEIQRGDYQYLNQHIKLLCEVMIGLGTTLGWISDKTHEKLIYVAYLHDIRLMKYPHLARIQTLKQFHEVSKTLTEAERKAFMEAPTYAAEVARQDNESYPDAIKILQQQKELPDGSGFPQGTVAAGLAPLSCLFIFSHYFVDYVINHADWSRADFIKTYQKQLRGGYFPKLFQALK